MTESPSSSSLPPRHYGPHKATKQRILNELKQLVLALNALISKGEDLLDDDAPYYLSTFWSQMSMATNQLYLNQLNQIIPK